MSEGNPCQAQQQAATLHSQGIVEKGQIEIWHVFLSLPSFPFSFLSPE